jgi:hypothetical protein
MHAFLLAFAEGVGIVCSMAGWGWLTVQALRVREAVKIGYCAAIGLALSTSLGGLLNLLHMISPAVVVAYLAAGILLALLATAFRASRWLSQAEAAWAYCNEHRFIAASVGIVIVLSLVKYAVAVSPGRFQPQDDYQGYFVFPIKMLQTGSLGSDPFSERRIQSSLGGKAFLDTFPLSLTGETRNLHLMDAGAAFLVIELLLAEIMIRKRLPAPWIIIVLLICTLLTAPAPNITAVYTASLLLLVLFDAFTTPTAQAGLAQAVVIGIALASLLALKTTFVPVAVLSWLGYVLLLTSRTGFQKAAVTNGVCAAGVAVTLVLPWMIDSYRSSGTLFYPFLVRGFHGSRYGIYLLPTAQLGMQNVLAFFHGTQDVLFAVLAVQLSLLLIGRQWKSAAGRSSIVIGVIVLLAVVMIAGATGAYQIFRYSFPVVFAGVLYLLIQDIASVRAAETNPLLSCYRESVGVLLVGLLLGGALEGFTFLEPDRLADLKFAVTDADINSPAEIAAYRAMQLSVPAGQKLLVFLDKHFLLNFRRNEVYINDTPGGASLPPGMPAFKGPEPVADYLLGVGVRYLAYSYADEANFTRAEFGSRLEPNVNVNLRVGATMAFDFEDNVLLLGRTRKRVFDSGKIFVLDLASRQDGRTALTSTLHS